MLIKHACAALAATLVLSGCATMGDEATADSNPIVGPVREGRCHMNGCSWFQVQNFEMVRETEKGALLRVTAREGSSMHPDGNYPRRPRESAIQWQPASDSYFFCSSRYPAIIYRNESGGGYDGYRLDLTMSAGVTEFVQNQYRAICHPDGAFRGEGAAQRLGYTRFEGEAEFTIARPEDVFDRAN